MRLCRRTPVVFMVLGMLALAAAAAADQGASERPFAPGGRVRLALSAGAYSIRAGRDDRIHVQWEARPSEGSQVHVDIQVTGTTAKVRTSGPRNGFRITMVALKDVDGHAEGVGAETGV